VFDSRRNLPPVMKSDQRRHRTARIHKDLARLQRIEPQRTKPDANLECTGAHKVELNVGDRTARRFDLLSGGRSRELLTGLPSAGSKSVGAGAA
jgi:hypothetical protein